MQYDLKKVIADNTKIELKWHGDDTRVLIAGDSVKTAVAKGDIISVTSKQARELLSYSFLWTLPEDEPTAHGYDTVAKVNAAIASKEKEEATAAAADDQENGIETMTKKEIISALKELGVSFNDQNTKDKLLNLLKESLAAAKSPVVVDIEPEVTDEVVPESGVVADDLISEPNEEA